MKIPKTLLAAMALTISTSVSLTSCTKNEELSVKTEQQNPETNEKGGEGNEPVCGGGLNPDTCPACGMG